MQELLRNRNRLPAVRRVRDLLRSEVVRGRFPRGVLPSELRLVAQYGVSRGVVREVLDLLRDEGLIDRLQGAGTFVVAPEPSPHGIEVLRALPDDIDRAGARLTWDVLDLGRLPAPPLVADRLGVAEGDDVVYLERVTSLDGRPFTQRSSWFPQDVGAPLLEPGVDLRTSMYDVLEDQLGRPVASAELRVEATAADAAIAPVLEIAVGAPVLLTERRLLALDGRPLELSFGRARGDRMVLTTVMRGPRPGAPRG